jgi:LytS/YehU family sensor histidine kinase
VPLAEELALVEHYLAIEKIRMGPRLSYGIDAPADLRSVLVPPLAVEILVENAVRHGLARRKDGGSVEVRVRGEGGSVHIEVADDGVGYEATPASPGTGTGFGILSVRQRLALLHGDEARLDVGPGPGGGTRAVLEVPLGH